MAQQQQMQQPNQPHEQGKGRKGRLWVRWLIVVVTFPLIAIGIIIWIISSKGPWLTILPIIIFTVLSVVIGLFQWLFPVSSGPPDHHTVTSSGPQVVPVTAVGSSVPQIVVHMPAITQPLQSLALPPEKAPYRGIIGFPPPTDSRTIQQREKIVKEVYEKLIQPDITSIVLTGIGGVGKSTLAALIHRYAEEQRHLGNGPFTAAALWLGINPTVTMTDLVGTLFEALGKPLLDFGSLTPQNLAVALFNALNTTEPARLIVLDQFEKLLDAHTGYALADSAGVGEWLDALNSQPCRCRVLLTSRPWPQGTREYPPTYMQEYQLKGMEIDEGIELLRKQGVGPETTDAELRTAVEHCAGHAFALTLLASFLRRNRSLNLATLFNNPTYAQLWTGDIARNLLNSIYTQQLNEVQRRLLLAFSIYREPVSLEAAQALIDFSAEVPREQVLPAFDALLRQHLLQASGEGRYQLHTIVADYAHSRFVLGSGSANLEALRTLHARAAQYYLQESCPPREERRQSSDVDDLVEAAWQLCKAEQWQEAYDLIVRENLFADLNRWGGNAILLELYLLLPLNRWHPSRAQEAAVYNHMGEVYRALGQMERAKDFLERALRICRETEDRDGEGWAINRLGRVYSVQGKRERARDYYEQALAIYRELGDRGEEVTTLNNLSGVHRAMGQRKQARQYCEQALSICKETGDRRGEGWTLSNLGEVYSVLGKREQALEYDNQALHLYREVGDRDGEGWALNNVGKVYDDLGQKQRALEYFEQALKLRREIGNRLGEGRTLKNLGKVYADLGQIQQALDCYQEALRICQELDRWGLGKTLNNLGRLYGHLGQKERGLEYLEQALPIRREVCDRSGEATTLNELGRVYAELGQKQRALRCYEQALRIRREVGERGGEGVTLHNIGMHYFDLGDYTVALACFLLAKSIFEEVHSPDRSETQRWIDELAGKVSEGEFKELLGQVELQASDVVAQALGKSM